MRKEVPQTHGKAEDKSLGQQLVEQMHRVFATEVRRAACAAGLTCNVPDEGSQHPARTNFNPQVRLCLRRSLDGINKSDRLPNLICQVGSPINLA